MDIFFAIGRMGATLTAPAPLLVTIVLVFLNTLRQRMIVAVIGGLVSGVIRHVRAQRVADDLGLRDPILLESLLWPTVGLIMMALLIHAIAYARKRVTAAK